ncbi:MAG TPA: ABC transporter substrate-binding protein [Candidatus Dormibacteraeota bacterium]|jgi:polar amino acid transport system substrate-binding protein|nr:ABC transporter substrate-binding protein [Candidatus Dormibacteraeota bacterium]
MLLRLRSRHPVRLAATLAAGATLLAACGSSNTTSGGGGSTPSAGGITASKVASIASELPSSVASKGTLTIAADASYAPNEFFDTDGKTVIGMDADLAKALGQVLGLQVSVTNATFDSILPGLSSGKYDLGMSSFTDTKEREKTVDFVTYFSAGTSFVVNASGGPTITTLDDLCGHHVAVEKGTTQADDAAAQDTKCKGAGKPGVDVQVYPDQSAANLALSSNRADVGMADSPVAAYQVKQSGGKFKVSGQPYGTAPYGIAIPKGNGMSKPLLDALKQLMTDGVYKNILQQWGIAGGAISNPQVNGALS